MKRSRQFTVVLGTWLFAVAISASEAAEPQTLFDGVSLQGWRASDPHGSEHWKVADGQIVGENADREGSNLWTTEEFSDFELTLEYMTPSEDYDSGVFLRADSHQVQIGISRSLKIDLTGCIYAPADGQGGYPIKSTKVVDVHKPGEWNKLRVVVLGKQIQTFLNGEPVVDYAAKTIPPSGPIGLQLHAGLHMLVCFRDIQLRPLDHDARD